MRIDGESKIALTLGAIDRSICSGVDDDIGRKCTHLFADLVGVREIEAGAVAADHFSRIGEALQKRPPHLSVNSGDENARPDAHANTSAVSSVAPFASLSETMASSGTTGHAIASSGSFQTMVRSPLGL